MTFRAGYVIDDQLGYEAVVFEDDLSGDGLSVQRTLEPDEQDVALGMDTYCVCLSSGSAVYGGVEAWSVLDGVITVSLSDDAELTRRFIMDLAAGQLSIIAAIARMRSPGHNSA